MKTSEPNDLQSVGVQERVSLYNQLKEQLLAEVERYRKQGNDNLADVISRSLDE
jgi:hypothetical protein